MALVFEQIVTEGLGDISYLIGDAAQGIAAVIDPRADVDVYQALAQKHKIAITHIFQTHIHEDFMSGATELAARLGNVRIYCSEENGASYGYAHEPLKNDAVFEFGNTVLRAKHTPGHTPEHMAFLVAESETPDVPYAVFSGGSLLINSAGRTDLLGPEQAAALTAAQYRTLYEFYLRLDDHVIVHPTHAHGSPCGAAISDRFSSTIGYERRFNPHLQCKSEQEFCRFALEELPPKPSYYPRLKETNTAGPPVLGNMPVVPALPAKEFKTAVDRGHSVVVDTRHMLAFGGGHIEQALNIGAAPQLPVWAGWMLDPNKPILLVLESDTCLEMVIRYFLRTGFTRFSGYLAGGMGAWENAGLPVVSTPQITAAEINARAQDIRLLDVRSPTEWRKGHIPNALHIYLPELPKRAAELSQQGPLAVYCDSGYRASLGASILKRAGFEDVANMPGSFQAWRNAGYSIEK